MLDNVEWIEEAVNKITMKMDWLSDKLVDKIPCTTVDGQYDNRADMSIDWSIDNGINWWTNGFWGGMLWLMYHQTGKEKYATLARKNEELLDRCFEEFYGLHHDVGFMWLPTAVADYRLTKDGDAKRRALHAATILAGRFNPVGKFIRAWNSLDDESTDTRGWAIIDCMLNIPLLYWASEETKDPRFKHIAMMHADTAMSAFVRPDGSVKHIVEFDAFTGELLRDYGGQGYAEGSSWTRGQTWGLYGFTISYIHTGKQEYLDTAKRIAHYFIANISEDGIIPVDFRQPKEPVWEDSCAAAIAASGLIELAKQVPTWESGLYLNAAKRLLKALYENRSDFTNKQDNMINNCTGAYHDEQHHIAMIYADYYFMEAIFKLKGNDIFLW